MAADDEGWTERGEPVPGPGDDPAGSRPASWQGPPTGAVAPDSRNWAMAAHLSAFAMFVGVPWFVGPLVIWLLKRDDPFVEEHGKEAVNFSLSLLIYGVALAVGGAILGVLTLGLMLIPIGLLAIVVAVGWLVLTIIAGVKASNGEYYRYPLTLRLVQ